MINPKEIVFVGQGPNRAAWERGIELGEHLNKLRADGIAPIDPVEIAERYCERLAITGAIGRKVSDMIGMEVGPFSRRYPRRNLNARWAGKVGKGDAFDRAEGERRAAAINAEPFKRHVLLGASVAACFGFSKIEPLDVRENRDTGRSYFFLPHPSGIVLWWNEPFNVFRAHKRLREFLGLPEPTEK